jgi:hypothetical protein
MGLLKMCVGPSLSTLERLQPELPGRLAGPRWSGTVLAVRFLPPIVPVSGRTPAGLAARVLSHLLDWSVQSFMQLMFAVAFAWDEMLALADDLASLATSPDVMASVTEAVADVLRGPLLVSVIAAWLLGGLLEVLLTVCFGGSLGKILLGLEVVDAGSGARPGWRRVAARWLGLGWAAPAGVLAPAAQFVPFAGYALAWFDPQRRAMHDRLTGLVVVTRHRLSQMPPPQVPQSPLDAYFPGSPR